MKCGLCKKKDADSYRRIVPGNELFPEIEKLNPDRIHTAKNSYFCNECVLLAENNLKQIQLLVMSHQNGISLSVSSAGQTARRVTMNKETGKPPQNREKPMPKQFKMANKLRSTSKPGPASSKIKRTESTPNVTAAENPSSQESQESDVPENLLLVREVDSKSTLSSQELDILPEGQKSPTGARPPEQIHNSPIPPLEDSGNNERSQEMIVLPQDQISQAETRPPVQSANPSAELVDLDANSSAELIDLERSRSHSHSTSGKSDDQRQPIAGPSAPMPKKPRLRQDRSKMTEDIQNFFKDREGEVNVNDYTRSLAG